MTRAALAALALILAGCGFTWEGAGEIELLSGQTLRCPNGLSADDDITLQCKGIEGPIQVSRKEVVSFRAYRKEK